MTKVGVMARLVCVAGALLLWPVAAIAISSSDGASASDSSSLRTRSGYFLRSSLSPGALLPEPASLGEGPESALSFEDPSSLVEAGAAADPRPVTLFDYLPPNFPDTPAVKKLKTAVSVGHLNKDSTKRMIKKLQTELTDPKRKEERQRVLARLRERHLSYERENEEIWQALEQAKKEVSSLGEAGVKAVEKLAVEALNLNNEQYAILEFQLPPH